MVSHRRPLFLDTCFMEGNFIVYGSSSYTVNNVKDFWILRSWCTSNFWVLSNKERVVSSLCHLGYRIRPGLSLQQVSAEWVTTSRLTTALLLISIFYLIFQALKLQTCKQRTLPSARVQVRQRGG
eukprot:m.84597 g.84597  ORF g.84597 m.84597 type:complete len:125 (-) comp14393_c5_seq1:27-401(-)